MAISIHLKVYEGGKLKLSRSFRSEQIRIGSGTCDLVLEGSSVAPTHAVPRLEHEHRTACGANRARRGEPRQPGTDHDHVVQPGPPAPSRGLGGGGQPRPERPGRTGHEELAATGARHQSSNSA